MTQQKPQRSVNDPEVSEKIEQFRQELEDQLEHSIEGHETKMIYIGFATLFIFAIVLYLAWRL
jgi:2',3'-cyclic-nucleotide 2'-phosphodiesterase (5'-nucleotidase family)